MDVEFLKLLREYIQAEIISGIYGNQEDESVYCGNNKAEQKEADRLFEKL